MTQYSVLRPVEYNGKLYVPASEDAPSVTKSAGNGNEIPVDRSGVIDLPDEVAHQFTFGQITPVQEKAPKPAAKNDVRK